MVVMPTGEEPPKGLEALYEAARTMSSNEGVRIDHVTASQLARVEYAEIDKLRTRAFERYHDIVLAQAADGSTHIGAALALINDDGDLAPESFTLGDALHIVPSGRTISDKLVFRVYYKRYLAAYGHVLTGWPRAQEWTILALVIDPPFRDHGIGKALLDNIQDTAALAGVKDVFLASTQTYETEGSESRVSLWDKAGYTTEVDRFKWKMGAHERDIVLYKKELTF